MKTEKFRAWDKKDNRMIVHEQGFIPLKVTNIGVFRLDAKIKENRWILIDLKRFIIEQFTGLKDSRGIRIYKGDVIKYLSLILPITTDYFHGLRFMYGKDQLCRAFANNGK